MEHTTDSPTPLQLATAARVSCSGLEFQLERRHFRKALVTVRKLWDRINAMANRIEDQAAEIERLQLELIYERSSKNHLETVDFPGVIVAPTTGDPLPDLGSVVSCSKPAEEPTHRVALGARPPGFEAVRQRLKKNGPRTEAIDRIKGIHTGDKEPAARKPRPRWGDWVNPQKKARPFERLLAAVEEKRLPVGTGSTLPLMQGDLVIEGAPYRLKREGLKTAIILPA